MWFRDIVICKSQLSEARKREEFRIFYVKVIRNNAWYFCSICICLYVSRVFCLNMRHSVDQRKYKSIQVDSTSHCSSSCLNTLQLNATVSKLQLHSFFTKRNNVFHYSQLSCRRRYCAFLSLTSHGYEYRLSLCDFPGLFCVPASSPAYDPPLHNPIKPLAAIPTLLPL